MLDICVTEKVFQTYFYPSATVAVIFNFLLSSHFEITSFRNIYFLSDTTFCFIYSDDTFPRSKYRNTLSKKGNRSIFTPCVKYKLIKTNSLERTKHILPMLWHTTHNSLWFNIFLFYVKSNDVDKSDKNVNKR